MLSLYRRLSRLLGMQLGVWRMKLKRKIVQYVVTLVLHKVDYSMFYAFTVTHFIITVNYFAHTFLPSTD